METLSAIITIIILLIVVSLLVVWGFYRLATRNEKSEYRSALFEGEITIKQAVELVNLINK